MIPVTLLVTTRNEAANIERCLSSAHQFIDQIFVIDSDSEDETVTIARKGTVSLSASFAGTVGVLFSAKQIFINPESFTFMESIGVLAMIILGGMGSIPGAILGAAVVTILNLQILKGLSLWLNELRNAGTVIFGYDLTNLPTQLEPAKYERMIFGLILVLMMIFRPQGILPAKRRHRELEEER